MTLKEFLEDCVLEALEEADMDGRPIPPLSFVLVLPKGLMHASCEGETIKVAGHSIELRSEHRLSSTWKPGG